MSVQTLGRWQSIAPTGNLRDTASESDGYGPECLVKQIGTGLVPDGKTAFLMTILAKNNVD